MAISAAERPATGSDQSNVGHTDATDDTSLRTCKVCGETKPLDLFTRTTASADAQPRHLHTCRLCRNAERVEYARRRREAGEPSSSTAREQRARVRAAYGHALVDSAPDPSVPRLLGELLRDSQRIGLPFDVAWSDDLEFVLARIQHRHAKAERESWRDAFEATRDSWEAAWSNEPGPGWRLNPALIDQFSGERERDTPVG
jgi:hypothetical protein